MHGRAAARAECLRGGITASNRESRIILQTRAGKNKLGPEHAKEFQPFRMGTDAEYAAADQELDGALEELRPLAVALNTVGFNRDTQGFELLDNTIALLYLAIVANEKRRTAQSIRTIAGIVGTLSALIKVKLLPAALNECDVRNSGIQ